MFRLVIPLPFSSNVPRRLSIGALILLTYRANATDFRDHFYAILGLTPEIDRSALVLGYTKSLKEVCSQFIKHII